MWSFRKEIHKINSIIDTTIPCDEAVSFNGNRGVFIYDVRIGTDPGLVELTYNAQGVPDRFQIFYENNLVADSLYVGNGLTGNPPDFSFMVGTTYNNVPELVWNGSIFSPNGNTRNITIQQSDVAPFGQTAGAGTISFYKSTATDIMTVVVSAPLIGTLWGANAQCPDSDRIPCNQTQGFSSVNQPGVYYTEVEVGTVTGTVVVDYDAGSIPDRFQVFYNNNLVADSLYVGDYLTGNPPNANTALWEGGGGSGMFVGKVYNNIPSYQLDGTSYVATGATSNFTVIQSDVAPAGQTAGAGQLTFNKSTATPTTITLVTTSLPANTGWDFTANCPTPPPPPPPNPITVINYQEDTTVGSCQTCATISVVVPQGQSRQVQFIKEGPGASGLVGQLCSSVGIIAGADSTHTISTTTDFTFGINAAILAGGGDTASTSITVIVREGGTTLDTYSISRTHSFPVNFC